MLDPANGFVVDDTLTIKATVHRVSQLQRRIPAFLAGIPSFPLADSLLASGLAEPSPSKPAEAADFASTMQRRLQAALDRAWAEIMRDRLHDLRSTLDAVILAGAAADPTRLREVIRTLETTDLSHSLLCSPSEVPLGCSELSAELAEQLRVARIVAIDSARANLAHARSQRHVARLETALTDAREIGIAEDELEADCECLVALRMQLAAVAALKTAMKEPQRTSASLGAAVGEAEKFHELRNATETEAARHEVAKLLKKEAAELAMVTAAEREDVEQLNAAISEAEHLGIRTKPAKRCLNILQALSTQDVRRLEQLDVDGLADDFVPAMLRERASRTVREATGQKLAMKNVSAVLRATVHNVKSLQSALAHAQELGVAEDDLQSAKAVLHEWHREDELQRKISDAFAARDLPLLREAVQTVEQAGVEAKSGMKAIKTLERELDLCALLDAPQHELAPLKQALTDAVAAGVDAEVLGRARRAVADLSLAREATALLKRIEGAMQAENEIELTEALTSAQDQTNILVDPFRQEAYAALDRMRHRRKTAAKLETLIDEDSLDIIQLETVYDQAEDAGCAEQLLIRAKDELLVRQQKMELQQELNDAMWAKDLERLGMAIGKSRDGGMDVRAATDLVKALHAEHDVKNAVNLAQQSGDISWLQETIKKATRCVGVRREVLSEARALLDKLQRQALEARQPAAGLGESTSVWAAQPVEVQPPLEAPDFPSLPTASATPTSTARNEARSKRGVCFPISPVPHCQCSACCPRLAMQSPHLGAVLKKFQTLSSRFFYTQ